MVDEAFVDAVGALFSVVVQDVKLQVAVSKPDFLQDICIGKTYGDKWQKDDIGFNIDMKYLMSGVSKDFVFELEIPPTKEILLQDY